MKYRKLRIAWSVGWGIACLLLIALWVRSYWRWDQVIGTPFEKNDLVISISSAGGIIFGGYASANVTPIPLERRSLANPAPRVTKKLDILVVADPDTASGKAKKAKEYGVRRNRMSLLGLWQ